MTLQSRGAGGFIFSFKLEMVLTQNISVLIPHTFLRVGSCPACQRSIDAKTLTLCGGIVHNNWRSPDRETFMTNVCVLTMVLSVIHAYYFLSVTHTPDTLENTTIFLQRWTQQARRYGSLP